MHTSIQKTDNNKAPRQCKLAPDAGLLDVIPLHDVILENVFQIAEEEYY